ncbi:hypothetical protein PILCRDRAFT_85821 [Piloderma croceum F 1598]|uniref:Uncharacterized protein n=1 Tax=Piloderma croceum (strain F 1598) TaxID=765440 RepID=A0A0C3G9K3_PILCF|nr:hypothetical protein PILCRDRAFT_85821 [Piloderma croceum F 1598]
MKLLLLTRLSQQLSLTCLAKPSTKSTHLTNNDLEQLSSVVPEMYPHTHPRMRHPSTTQNPDNVTDKPSQMNRTTRFPSLLRMAYVCQFETEQNTDSDIHIEPSQVASASNARDYGGRRAYARFHCPDVVLRGEVIPLQTFPESRTGCLVRIQVVGRLDTQLRRVVLLEMAPVRWEAAMILNIISIGFQATLYSAKICPPEERFPEAVILMASAVRSIWVDITPSKLKHTPIVLRNWSILKFSSVR